MDQPTGTHIPDEVERTFTRLSVITPVRQLDVAVPDDLPSAQLARAIIRETGLAGDGWLVLDHPTAGLLAPQATPADLQLRDGDILTLRPLSPAEQHRPVDDLAERIAEDTAPASGWSAETTRFVFAAGLAAWCLLAVALSSQIRPVQSQAYVVGTALLVLIAGQLLAKAAGRPREQGLLALALIPAAAYSGWLVSGVYLTATMDRLALASAGVAAAVSLAALVDPPRRQLARSALLGFGAAAPALLLARMGPGFGWDGAQVAACVTVVTAGGLGFVTHVAASTSGLLRLDTDAAEGAPVQAGDVESRQRKATNDIAALLTGLCLAGAVACVALLLAGNRWALATGIVMIVVMLSRARAFIRRVHVGIPLVAPVLALGAATLSAAAAAPLGTLAPVVLLGAVPLTALALITVRDIQQARAKVWLDRLEVLALIALVPLVLAVFDVYAQVYQRFS